MYIGIYVYVHVHTIHMVHTQNKMLESKGKVLWSRATINTRTKTVIEALIGRSASLKIAHLQVSRYLLAGGDGPSRCPRPTNAS